MTNRGKMILFTSVILSLSVITTVILYLKTAANNGTANTISQIAAGLIITVGIISIPVVYVTKIKKRRYENLLNKEYYIEYEIVKDIISNSQISFRDKREITEDILELFITAQEANKPINEVMKNPQEFAQDMLNAYGSRNRGVLEILEGVIFFSSFILGIQLITWLENKNIEFFETRLDLSMIAFLFILSFILVPFLRKATSKRNPFVFGLPLAFGVGYVLIMETMTRFFYNIELIKMFLNGTINVVRNMVVLILIILSIPIALYIKSVLRKNVGRA